jgi:ribosomal protein S18 acetylase RimI-like enzyme
VADLGRRTFEETFGPGNDADDMATYLAEAFAVQHVAAELADPANTFLVAEDTTTGELCGYFKLHRGLREPCVSGRHPVELQRIYVDQSAIGTGLGTRLMETALAEALTAGFDTVWLGVWEHNPRAIAFYERWGFSRVGEHTFVVGRSEQTDWIMERTV